jgi:hypothetical protein
MIDVQLQAGTVVYALAEGHFRFNAETGIDTDIFLL